jgi:hypothetical protein
MNELDMIRAVLDEAPPSAEVVAEGRRRIAAGATGPRRPRARPVLPAAGLTAAALVAAGAITLVAMAGPPGSPGGSAAHRVSSTPAGGTLTVTELAYRAAAAAARQPGVRPGQWVYRKYLTKEFKYLTKDFPSRATVFWTTANALKAAWVSADGRVHFFSGLASLGMTAVPVKKIHGTWAFFGFGLLPVKYADLGSLPRSPKALDRYLGHLLPRGYGPKADREFLIIGEMLTAYVMPPALTAEFYRALGDIPGITVDPHAVDVAGRPGVAFTLKKPVALGVTPEIIVNPHTYHLMANEVLIPRTPGSPGRARSAAGTAILQEALVSGPGIKP